MKTQLLTALLAVSSLLLHAQVKVVDGPPLTNDKDNKMNRLIQGEKDDFYAYRIRSKGKGTTFYVEKYNKQSLKPDFSKEINLGENDDDAKIEDVEYASGNVFIFRRTYDKKKNKMSLYYQTVSNKGEVKVDLVNITDVTSDHYEYVDFDIFPNPSKTKFLIKSSHKANKEDEFVTDFFLMDAVSKKILFTKTIKKNLKTGSSREGALALAGMLGGGLAANIVNKSMGEDIGFIGLLLDDQDNFYFGFTDAIKDKAEGESRYTLSLAIWNAKSNTPVILEAKFDSDYYVKDIAFSKNNNNEIIMGGFVKDVVERTGADLVNVGIFSFTFDLKKNSIKSRAVKIFDKPILTSLESSAKLSKHFKYKLDYIMPIGESIYFVGEQYSEQAYSQSSYGGSSTNWRYEYMDVIVAKLNKNGEFEWIKNTPLRNAIVLSTTPHVFKQYIAVAGKNDIYIMANEHPKNMAIYEKPNYKPVDLKTVSAIHGSNFVSSQINLNTGNIKHTLIFKNETYCFAPIQERNRAFMPPSDCEIFVLGENNTLFIYTEDRGADRFSKLIFE